ncbi:MAG: hypothetical protein AAF684_01560 [Pseudomonadota bacterium]
MSEIKQSYADRIELNLAAYSPFGFRDDQPGRWSLMQHGAQLADFLGFLPEADDTDEYPAHIGFDEHCRRAIEMSVAKRKVAHIHLDQRNEPTERGIERLVAVAEKTPPFATDDGSPSIWGVHVISPTTYTEERFEALVAKLAALNIGVICCPTAALGMRQLRPVPSPTDNSFPRLLDFIAGGVSVRLASDNIADNCSPSTTPDLVDEILAASAACRFYDPEILAKIACGRPIEENDRAVVRDHLAENRREIDRTLHFLGAIQQ